MSEIIIDITRLLDRFMQARLATGVDRVNLEYVRHFYGRAAGLVRFGGRWLELGHVDSRRLFSALLDRPAHFNALVRSVVGRAYVVDFRSKAGRGRFFINAGHSGLDLPTYGRRLATYDVIPLFFIHDLIPLTHPEYCRPNEANRHLARMNTVLSVGKGVICNSEVTRSDLGAFAKHSGQPMPDSTVAWLAPAALPAPAKMPPLSMPYFVLLGTIEPRKNHALILHVWRQLVAQLGELAPKLVIIGQRGWECENVVDLLERCEAVRNHVLELPSCSDAELATYVHYSRALLFPSFTEGFGMPLVEALSLGTPVIASDLPVFREIAGGVPAYLDPLDGLGWMEVIQDYARADSPGRAEQLSRMANYRAPTWGSHFAQVETLMERLRK